MYISLEHAIFCPAMALVINYRDDVMNHMWSGGEVAMIELDWRQLFQFMVSSSLITLPLDPLTAMSTLRRRAKQSLVLKISSFHLDSYILPSSTFAIFFKITHPLCKIISTANGAIGWLNNHWKTFHARRQAQSLQGPAVSDDSWLALQLLEANFCSHDIR